MTRPKTLYAAAGGLALTWASSLAWAPRLAWADAPAPLGELVVTSIRLPAPLASTPDVHVLTQADIDRRGAVLATDLLTTVPGVTITQNGAFGGTSTVHLRGASTDKTLVLIDGVPVNDPSAPAGGFDFSSLDVADISRIEVLSGPQGALWGSDAIGGVIALTTREPNGVRAAVEGGSLETLRDSLAVGRATDRYALGLSYAGFRTAGVSKADTRDGNTERDGFNTTTVAVNGRWAVSDRISLDGRARYNQAGTEFDGFGGPTGVIDSADHSDVRTGSGFVRARIAQVLGFDHEVRVDILALNRRYLGEFPYSAKGDRQIYRWSAQRQGAAYGLAFGVEHQQAGEDTGDGRQTASADAGYAIGRFNPVKRLTLTISLRHDAPQHYRGQTTAKAAASLHLGAGFVINAAAGQGFKTPSIFETTYPCFECATPGPATGLKPEYAEGWDGGLGWRSAGDAIQADLTVYALRIRDQIDYVYPNGYLNIESVRTSGIEASGQARLGAGWSVRAAYSHTDAVDGATGTRLIRIPHNSGSGSISWEGRGLRAEIGARGQDDAPDVYGVTKGFAIAYASADYAITPHFSVTGRLENLGDSHYQQAFGYGEPGRMILVGLRWR